MIGPTARLGDLDPQPLEHDFIAALERKVRAAVSMYVEAVRVLEQACGPGAVDAVRQQHLQRVIARAAAQGRELGDNSLVTYCAALEQGCRFSHTWEKVQATETCQEYRFHRCMWADVFRSLRAERIGYWICESDGPAAAAFNPRIKFRRTQTLMLGDECCDHLYYVQP